MKKILGISKNTLEEIKNLFSDTDIQGFSFIEEECTITVSRKQKHSPVSIPVIVSDSTVPTPPTVIPVSEDVYADDSKYEKVKSPIVGTFYTASSPGSPNFIEVGATITAGSTACIVEAMKIFNEIKSPVSGNVVSILKKKGDHVDAGDVLFIVEK